MTTPATTRAAAGLLRPALMTAVMLAILLSLGVWQLQRRTWKHALLARIDAAEAAPPIPLQASGTPPAFAIVHLTGTLMPGITGRYGSSLGPAGNALGSQVLAVIERTDGPPVIAALGWLPDAATATLPASPIDIVGYVRAPDHPTWLSASDQPSKHRFYTLDPAAIGAALGVADPAPFTLVATRPVMTAPDAPVPDAALPRPPDDHLQYAVTWFGLAASLLAVFVVYVKGMRRTAPSSG